MSARLRARQASEFKVSVPSVSGQQSPREQLMARISGLTEYCRESDWAGYDPYDALNSRLFARTPLASSKFARIGATQCLKRLPINVRRLLLIPRHQNPKAIALFLMAFVKLRKVGVAHARELSAAMVERLVALRSPHAPYWCWGYSFPWQTRKNLVPRWAPNIVCTSFVANALLDLNENDPDPRYLDMATSAADYILDVLYWEDGGRAASFAYPVPSVRTPVHNANFLGAALLSRLWKLVGNAKYIDAALKTARYSASQQERDGSWRYGEAAVQRWVDNFHTGYNLCALRTIRRSAGTAEFDDSIRTGFEFYRRNFFREDGAPKYFDDRTYPIDIHSVAQSIITLVEFGDLDEENLVLAQSVLRWADANMLGSDGYYYYQVHPSYKNRISYIRWSQAWMLLALSVLLEQYGDPLAPGYAQRTSP